MLASIIHAARVLHSVVRETVVKGFTRSPQWPSVRDAHLKAHPSCAACGGADRLQVHHKLPFHDDPSLELHPDNLITLCMATNLCHVHIGHGDSFKYFNPNVETDATDAALHPDRLPEIQARAEANRKENKPGVV